ncbi:MAG: HAD family hydrolase [Sciscionella sp.]|nr:HAD family hydrolase [Sciscionella sp.]
MPSNLNPVTFAPLVQTPLQPRQGRTGSAGIRAVCLDVDDTLVDYTGSAIAGLRAMLGGLDDDGLDDDTLDDGGVDDDTAREPSEAQWELWQRITDAHLASVIAGTLDYRHMHARRTKAFLAAIGRPVDDAGARRLEAVRRRAMRAAWRLFPDALPCLQWLRAIGLRIAGVTNASGEHQRAKLAALGVAEYFDTLVIAGELGVAKPDPAIFHTACLDLGVRREDTVHIGDKLDVDAIGAHDAGLRGVWLNRLGTPTRHRRPGVLELDSLAELPELLVCELELAVL